MNTQYILDIEWDRPSSDSPVLPPLVGPFLTHAEARDWAALNIPNGSWEVRPIAWPYYQSTRVIPPAETEEGGE